jgi:hypothetical protein
MPYSAEISRANPTCFLFLIDRSASMADKFGAESGRSKAAAVADAINRLLQTLVLRCAKSQGVRDYYHVGVIGYGKEVLPALGGTLTGQVLVPVSQLADHPLRVEQRVRKVPDGAGGIVEQSIRFPIWFEPVADGNTPMCQALGLARRTLEDFVTLHAESYPPIVINITDGECNDGNPEFFANDIRGLATKDGNVLLLNAHLSTRGEQPVQFPESQKTLPDEYARMLFRMSSVLPPAMLEAARRDGLAIGPQSRGFVFNADLVSVIQFLDIGTRPFDWSQLR